MVHRRMLIAAALSMTGCSWIFMTKPPDSVAVPHLPVDCTTSRAAPVLDTICSGYFVVNGIVLLAVKDCANASFGENCANSSTKTGGALLSAGLAVVCGVSAASGYGNAARCEQIKDSNLMCMSGDVSACRRLKADWTPPGGWQPIGSFPPQAPAGPEPPVPVPGCARDTDCKGDRICEQGVCVAPKR